MATGTGNLPFPGKVYNPFDILTAEELNEDVSNIEALATGSGIGDGAVTPIKRAGGFRIDTIPSATMATTGSKAITGVGFRPKLVRFCIIPTSNATNSSTGIGAYDGSSQFTQASSGNSRFSSTTACISQATASSAAAALLASGTSLDADGFTINVTTALPTNVIYEAYA